MQIKIVLKMYKQAKNDLLGQPCQNFDLLNKILIYFYEVYAKKSTSLNALYQFFQQKWSKINQESELYQ